MTIKTYPWAPADLSDPNRIFAVCPQCDWKQEIKNKKSQAFFKHYDNNHR